MNSYTKLPSAAEVELAKLARHQLSAAIEASGEAQRINVIDRSGKAHEIMIPSSTLNIMVEVLTQLSQGNSVRITPVHVELTTQEGADMLNMSRPTFIRLLDSNEIPFSRTGNRRRVSYADVMEYKSRQQENRLAALEELSASDQDLDMGY